MRIVAILGAIVVPLIVTLPVGAVPTWYSSDPLTPPAPDPHVIYCPAGQQVIGGSCECAGDAITKSFPAFEVQGQGWRCSCERVRPRLGYTSSAIRGEEYAIGMANATIDVGGKKGAAAMDSNSRIP